MKTYFKRLAPFLWTVALKHKRKTDYADPENEHYGVSIGRDLKINVNVAPVETGVL